MKAIATDVLKGEIEKEFPKFENEIREVRFTENGTEMFKYEVTVDDGDSFISKLSGHMTIENSKITVTKIKSERKRSRSSSRTSSNQYKDKKVKIYDVSEWHLTMFL